MWLTELLLTWNCLRPRYYDSVVHLINTDIHVTSQHEQNWRRWWVYKLYIQVTTTWGQSTNNKQIVLHQHISLQYIAIDSTQASTSSHDWQKKDVAVRTCAFVAKYRLVNRDKSITDLKVMDQSLKGHSLNTFHERLTRLVKFIIMHIGTKSGYLCEKNDSGENYIMLHKRVRFWYIRWKRGPNITNILWSMKWTC